MKTRKPYDPRYNHADYKSVKAWKITTRQMVERRHVGESYRRVMRYVISRFREDMKAYWAMPKPVRRAMWKGVIANHKENRKLFNFVAQGR